MLANGMAWMVSHRNNTISAVVGMAFLLLSPVAMAEPPAFNDNALVTIRFNQERVYYDQQLYGAISKAVGVKPSVTFDVVAYAPSTGNAAVDAQWQQAASAHAQAVVASMQNLGVPLSRMNVSGQHLPGLAYDEVHVIPR